MGIQLIVIDWNELMTSGQAIELLEVRSPLWTIVLKPCWPLEVRKNSANDVTPLPSSKVPREHSRLIAGGTVVAVLQRLTKLQNFLRLVFIQSAHCGCALASEPIRIYSQSQSALETNEENKSPLLSACIIWSPSAFASAAAPFDAVIAEAAELRLNKADCLIMVALFSQAGRERTKWIHFKLTS